MGLATMLDTTDKASCLRYRIAYGAAANLLEAGKYDHSFGRAYAGKVGDQGEKILAEVLRQVGDRGRELVELGVSDALAGRRPRW
jgi:hypothetical protein